MHHQGYPGPTQLKKTGYRNPSNGIDCGFQLDYKTEFHFFHFLKDQPLPD